MFTILLSVFISVLGIGNIIPVMPLYASNLGASGLALAIIIAAFSVSRSILQPIVGNYSDSLGKRKFLISGLIIYAAVGLLIPESNSIPELIVLRLLHGIGSAMIVPVAMAYVSMLTPVGQEGRYMSYLNMAIFTGMGCGPIIGGFFYDHYGFRSVFYSMAVMSVLAASLVLIFLPKKEEITPRKQGTTLFSNFGKMLKSNRTIGILIARYATMLVMVPCMGFLPLLMAENFTDISVTTIGMIIACRTLINASLQMTFGKMADKYSKNKLLIVGGIIMSIALAGVPSATILWQVFLLYALLGTGEAMVWAALGAFATLEGREKYGHGTMMGVFNLAISTGVLTGSLIAGFGMDILGIIWAFYLPAMILVILVIFGVCLIKSSEKDFTTQN